MMVILYSCVRIPSEMTVCRDVSVMTSVNRVLLTGYCRSFLCSL